MSGWEASGAGPRRQHAAHVDQVVRDDAEPHPAFHAVIPFVAAAIEPVPPFHDADATLTPRAPLLPVLEPPSLLLTFPLGTLRGSIGNANARDALRVRRRLIGARVERGIARHQA